MCPGQRAMIRLGCRLVAPVGSIQRRRFSPSCNRCRPTVRIEMVTPSAANSVAIRRAEYFRARRSCSIRMMTSATDSGALRWCTDGSFSRWTSGSHFSSCRRKTRPSSQSLTRVTNVMTHTN